MRVLVTRPREDAEETAARLVALGHEAILAPLLDIEFRGGAAFALDDVQAVLVTSANGIRALAQRTKRRDVRVLAVGAQSGEAARAAGFYQVSDAAGDVAALADLVATALAPENGSLFYAAGMETRGQLKEVLEAQGFSVREEKLYEAIAVSALPAALQDALASETLDAALFFSPRTAHIFARLVERAGLAGPCESLIACCISAATAKALEPLLFAQVSVAPEPNQDKLLALLSGS